MKLIAQKPCSFGGEQFYIGDEIPSELVLDPQAQAKMGVMAIVAGDAAVAAPMVEVTRTEVEVMPVVIHAKEGDMTLNLSAESFQAITDVLTGTLEVAEPIIAQMTDEDALIFLHVADGRKTVKDAAEARATELNTENPDNGQNPDPNAGVE